MTIPKPPSQPGCEWVEECIESCDVDPVYVEENGVRASFANPRSRQICKIKYDGCYNRNARDLKADFIVGLPNIVDVIVELKGSDRKHARDQVESTLEKWRLSPIRFPKIVCLIVYGRLEGKERKAGRIPKMNSSNESLELDFLRRNKTLLWVRESSAVHHRFAELLGRNNAE